ncbi:MAG: hypothetical protein ACYC8T_35550, partial [Myxococcaceae bacterium]
MFAHRVFEVIMRAVPHSHFTRHRALGLVLACALLAFAAWWSFGRSQAPRLLSAGPRLLSNQTSQPLSLKGSGLSP